MPALLHPAIYAPSFHTGMSLSGAFEENYLLARESVQGATGLLGEADQGCLLKGLHRAPTYSLEQKLLSSGPAQCLFGWKPISNFCASLLRKGLALA